MMNLPRSVMVVALGAALALATAAGAAGQSTEPPVPPPKPPVPPVPPIPSVPQLPTLPEVPEVPDVPQDPAQLADMLTPLSPQLMLGARPHRARALPARFRLTGWLRPPMRLDRVAGFFEKTLGLDLGVCTGPVTVAFRSGGATVARRRASVTRTCTFRSSITIRSRRRLGPAGRLRATARFGGSALLGPVRHSIVLHTR